MTKITSVSGKSIAGKIVGLTVLAATGAALYFGTPYISTVKDEVKKEISTYSVTSAINDHDTTKAEIILSELEKQPGIKPDVIKVLHLEVERAKKIEGLEKKISTQDFEGANKELQGLETLGLPNTKIDELRKKVNGISEQKLYQNILSTPALQRTPLCYKFLASQKQGPIYQEVVKELVLNELELLNQDLNSGAGLDTPFARMVHLNKIFDSYVTKLSFPAGLPDAVHDNYEFFLNNHFVKSDKDIELGDAVMVFNAGECRVCDSNYVVFRNKNIPLKVRGEVIHTYQYDSGMLYYVRLGKKPWKQDHKSIEDFTLNGETNVVMYQNRGPLDIRIEEPFSDVQKHKMRLEGWKLVENMRRYEPKKQVELLSKITAWFQDEAFF